MNLREQCVLVTASRRLGAAIAREFMERGAHVCVLYHRRPPAEQLLSHAASTGVDARAIQADLSTPEGCAAAVDAAARWRGRLDVLVNVASRYERTHFDALDEPAWDRALAVDLAGTWWCCQAARPWLTQSARPRIVTFADWVAASGRPRYFGYLPYYVAKCGVIALTEALARAWRQDGILVNCVAPGPLLPPPDTTTDTIRSIARETPLGRWGGESAAVQVVMALVESEGMSGETVRVDGGRHLR